MINDELSGEFAIVYYDKKEKKIYAARDRHGVRPLYYGYSDNGFGFASELKALHPVMKSIEQLLPTHIYEIDVGTNSDDVTGYVPDRIQYYFYEDIRTEKLQPIDTVKEQLNFLLTQAVTRKLGAHRKMGFLLSGGLDSSLIVAIAAKILGPENMECFSIGVDGSPDVEASKEVVKYLGIQKHHIIPFDLEEGFDLLSDIIRDVETYDVTTVRASAPQYIMAKYIRDNTDVRVILSGEGSDEIHGSYRYFRDAFTSDEFHKERIRLARELHWFDNKRTDRTMAHHGLEVRVPFLDFEYVHYVLKTDPKLFMHSRDYMEKMILRDSFKGYLPDSILYRSKEAFSDAVSSNELNWKSYIEMRLEKSIVDDFFDHEFIHDNSLNDKPKTKTALYFLRLFSKHYPQRFNVLPHQWMPRFQIEEVTDPSATILKSY
jgi:asparagine synthase (glutamine-hydrolysing)